MKPANNWPTGFVVYDEADIKARQIIVEIFTHRLKSRLQKLNPAINFMQIETPISIPEKAVQGHKKIGFDLVEVKYKHPMYLRPETPWGTYQYFLDKWPMENKRKKICPIVLWQCGKSFRNEQERPFGELRFKEFYQLEYQLIYTLDTKADYFGAACDSAYQAVMEITGRAAAENVTDLAHYSERTWDIYNGDHEVAAVSLRNDLEGYAVVEVSVGLDRLTALRKIYK